MKKLYVHIGLPKTATSSIQNFLFNNDHFLNKNGYHYVKTGLNTDLQCHHDLIWTLGLHQGPDYVQRDIQDNKDMVLQELAAEHKQHSDKHLIISSELLTFLGDFKRLAPILAIFNDRDIKFVVNLRRQDTFLESLYQQVVKDGISDTFETWYPKARNIADYNLLINNVLQVTEKENIIIDIFNSRKKGFNPTREFLSSIDLHDKTIGVENCSKNERLPASCIKIIRFSNSLNLKINYKLIDFFSKYKDRIPLLSNNGGYLNDDQSATILREFNISNKALTDQIKLQHDVEQEILSW